MNLKRISQIFIVIGFVLLLLFGFLAVFSMTQRAAYIYDYDSGSESDINYSLILEPDHEYEITVTFYDRAGSEYEIARVQGSVVFFKDGVEVDRAQFSDYSQDEDEISSVSEFYFYIITPTAEANLTITGELVEGDEWWINVYRDIPAFLDEMAFYTFVVFLMGIVLLFVGAGLFVKAKRSISA